MLYVVGPSVGRGVRAGGLSDDQQGPHAPGLEGVFAGRLHVHTATVHRPAAPDAARTHLSRDARQRAVPRTGSADRLGQSDHRMQRHVRTQYRVRDAIGGLHAERNPRGTRQPFVRS